MSKGPYFQTGIRSQILQRVTKEAKIPTLDFRPVSCVENRGLLKRRRSSFGTKKCLWKMINVQSWHQLWYTYDPKLLVSLFHSSCGSRFFVRAGNNQNAHLGIISKITIRFFRTWVRNVCF